MLVGHGRVGSVISPGLIETKTPLLVIEDDVDGGGKLKAQGIETISGNAADPEVIAAANLRPRAACWWRSPMPSRADRSSSRRARINPSACASSPARTPRQRTQHLMRHGATMVVMGEHEIAKAMIADVAAQPRMSRE